MSRCCPKCFRYTWLVDRLSASAERGRCDFCKSRNVALTPVAELSGPFQNLTSAYGIASDELDPWQDVFEAGEPLHRLIEDHWGVFSQKLINSELDSRLLTAILRSGWDDDSGEPLFDPHELYVWRHQHSAYDEWQVFKESVCEDEAFEPELPNLHLYLEGVAGSLERGTTLFRAVPGWAGEQEGRKQPYLVGPPPPDKVRAGRANRENQRVAYCAQQEETALAEVRPAKGNIVSLGQVRLRKDVRVIDIGHRLPTPNPFTTENLLYEAEERSLLNGFADDLSEPLRRNDNPREYLPTQRLADRLRDEGVAGVIYPSAMNPGGTNVVIFDPDAVEPANSRLVEVTDIQVRYHDLPEFL